MRAVLERMPVRLHLQADFQLVDRTVDDVRNEVDADIERDAHDCIGLGATERGRAALGDGVGEHRALARNFTPLDITSPSREDAHRPREMLVLAGRLAMLDDELLLLRALPVGLGVIEMLDSAFDAERVVEFLGHPSPRLIVAFSDGKPVPTFPENALFRDQHQGRARAPVASVVDPADAGHQRVLRVLDLALAGFTAQLPHRLDQVVGRARRLPRRDLAAAGIERQVAVVREVVIADERAALARLAEAECLELQHDRDDEVVVGVKRGDVLDAEAGRAERLLAADLVTALGHVHQVLAALEVGQLGIADRDDGLVEAFLLGALAAHHDEPGRAVRPHHAVEQADRIGDHARVHVVVDRDRHAQLLAGVLVHDRMVALRHRDLAEHAIVEAVFRLVGAAEQPEGAGWPHQAIRVGPLAAIGVAVVGAVLQHVRVGEEKERDLAHAVIDRRRRPHDRTRRRAAAGVDLLAEADLEPQHVGGGLRPERVGGAGAGQARQHEPVDLVLVDAGLVEQLLEDLASEHPHVAVALLHHLGFGVAHDRIVTQSHLRALP